MVVAARHELRVRRHATDSGIMNVDASCRAHRNRSSQRSVATVVERCGLLRAAASMVLLLLWRYWERTAADRVALLAKEGVVEVLEAMRRVLRHGGVASAKRTSRGQARRGVRFR